MNNASSPHRMQGVTENGYSDATRLEARCRQDPFLNAMLHSPTGFFASPPFAVETVVDATRSLGATPVNTISPSRVVLAQTSPPSMAPKSRVRHGSDPSILYPTLGKPCNAGGGSPAAIWPSLPNAALGDISPPGAPRVTGMWVSPQRQMGMSAEALQLEHIPMDDALLAPPKVPRAVVGGVFIPQFIAQPAVKVPSFHGSQVSQMSADLDSADTAGTAAMLMGVAHPAPRMHVSRLCKQRKQAPSCRMKGLFELVDSDSDTEPPAKKNKYGTYPRGILVAESKIKPFTVTAQDAIPYDGYDTESDGEIYAD